MASVILGRLLQSAADAFPGRGRQSNGTVGQGRRMVEPVDYFPVLDARSTQEEVDLKT
jgi:hypothetical protein